jgi:hypothetical protein
MVNSPEYQTLMARGTPKAHVNRLKNTGAQLDKVIAHDERLGQLKKQVEDANKRIGALTDEFKGLGERVTTVGIPLHPDLGMPAAGLAYTPHTLSDSSPAHAQSHIQGYRSEIRLANDIAHQGKDEVVHYGDKIGTNHADVVSVDKKTGDVTLWDAKYRSEGSAPNNSETFTQSGRRWDAADQAINVLRSGQHNLPREVALKAIENLEKGNYKAVTSHTDGGPFRHEVQTFVGDVRPKG